MAMTHDLDQIAGIERATRSVLLGVITTLTGEDSPSPEEDCGGSMSSKIIDIIGLAERNNALAAQVATLLHGDRSDVTMVEFDPRRGVPQSAGAVQGSR